MNSSEASSVEQELDTAYDADLLGDIDVWTPEIDRFVDNVSRWVRMDSPGGIASGLHRIGKTHACQLMVKALPMQFGNALICIHLTMGDPPPRSEHGLVQRIMAQTGCRSILHRDLEVLRGRLIDHLHELTISAGSKRIVILWDEAQNLERLHYGWLLTLFNELEHRRLRPFFLLVGQPELRNARSELRASQQIIGRFFSHEHEFRGIAINELGEVLDALDSDEDGGDIGPRRFMPRQYAEGFRLTNLAEPLTTALEALRNKHQLEHVLLPMQYLRSTVIRALIRILRDSDIVHQHIGPAVLLECLKETGFLQVLLVYAVRKD